MVFEFLFSFLSFRWPARYWDFDSSFSPSSHPSIKVDSISLDILSLLITYPTRTYFNRSHTLSAFRHLIRQSIDLLISRYTCI